MSKLIISWNLHIYQHLEHYFVELHLVTVTYICIQHMRVSTHLGEVTWLKCGAGAQITFSRLLKFEAFGINISLVRFQEGQLDLYTTHFNRKSYQNWGTLQISKTSSAQLSHKMQLFQMERDSTKDSLFLTLCACLFVIIPTFLASGSM